MDNELITKESELIISFIAAIARVSAKLESTLGAYRPVLQGERYLSDKELSERLRISRRALQDYRNAGRIPYYQLGGKILYRESEIQDLLERNHTNVRKSD